MQLGVWGSQEWSPSFLLNRHHFHQPRLCFQGTQVAGPWGDLSATQAHSETLAPGAKSLGVGSSGCWNWDWGDDLLVSCFTSGSLTQRYLGQTPRLASETSQGGPEVASDRGACTHVISKHTWQKIAHHPDPHIHGRSFTSSRY